MKLKKPQKSGRQWKVVQGVHVTKLEGELDVLSARGWDVRTILGPPGNLAIVATRVLVL